MKIAVTYDNGNVFQHFGRTEFFKVYEVEDNQVVSSEIIGSNGTGHGALAGLLADQVCGCADLRRYRRRSPGSSRRGRGGAVCRGTGEYGRGSRSLPEGRTGIFRSEL